MKKAALLLGIFSVFCIKATLTALCPESYIDFFVGGHAENVKFHVPELNSVGSPATATYDLKNIAGPKVGFKGQVALSQRWFLKGFFDYGWVTAGRFSYTDSTDSTATVKGSANGNVANINLALGYMFYPTACFEIAPLFGWAYDKVQIFTGSTTLNGISTVQHKIKTYWGGPFVGVDGIYHISCQWKAYAGYEFHYTTNQIKIMATSATTIRGHIRNLIGNVLRIGAQYAPCCPWHFGIEASGSTYTSCQRNGWINPNSIAGSYSQASLQHVRINLAEILLRAGFDF